MILFADDNDLTRHAVGRLLRVLGEKVIEAPDGDHALALIQVLPVEIAIVDYRMRRGGTELLDRIREVSKIPVICCSGLSPEYLLDTKYDAYLWKPIDVGDLRAAIEFVRTRRNQGTP